MMIIAYHHIIIDFGTMVYGLVEIYIIYMLFIMHQLLYYLKIIKMILNKDLLSIIRRYVWKYSIAITIKEYLRDVYSLSDIIRYKNVRYNYRTSCWLYGFVFNLQEQNVALLPKNY